MECGERRGCGSSPTAALAFDAISRGGMTAPGVSRQAAIADNGPMFTGVLDDNRSVSYDATAADSSPASPPASAEVFSDWGPAYAKLSSRASYADVDLVGP